MFPLFQTSGKVTITELRTPSEIFHPSLSIDGDQWCALYGENIQDGVTGFGKSPQEAMNNFDKNFNEKLAPQPNIASIQIPKRPPKIPIGICIDSKIIDEFMAEKAAINHIERNFPQENRIETERIIGCKDYNCQWNSDYTCFHEFPIFAFRGIMGFTCLSKED